MSMMINSSSPLQQPTDPVKPASGSKAGAPTAIPAQAMSLAVNGFVNDLVRQFPMEYSVELKRLIDLEMEGSVG